MGLKVGTQEKMMAEENSAQDHMTMLLTSPAIGQSDCRGHGGGNRASNIQVGSLDWFRLWRYGSRRTLEAKVLATC